jgi:hypothetical protein
LKVLETTKLFYNEYPYKIVLRNALGHIFRDKNYKVSRDILDSLQLKYEKGEPLTWGSYLVKQYEVDTFIEAKYLYSEFIKFNNYKIRIENPIMQIYSSDLNWLKKIAKNVSGCYELWEPTTVLSKNTIVVSKPTPFQYRVTIQSNQKNPNLATWITNNPDKAKGGRKLLSELTRDGLVRGLYFYVRDEKVLNLLGLMLSHPFRVDKVITKQDNDK